MKHLKKDKFVHAGYFSGKGLVKLIWEAYVLVFDPYWIVHGA